MWILCGVWVHRDICDRFVDYAAMARRYNSRVTHWITINTARPPGTLREASAAVRKNSPSLSLRFYKGMNPYVYSKALDVIGQGGTYPMLYNDDVWIPAGVEAFGLPAEVVAQYVMSNCGEQGIEHQSIHSPNGSINYPKILELTLFNGEDPLSGRASGLKTGDMAKCTGMDQLMDAFKTQAEYFIRLTSDRLMPIYNAMELDGCGLFDSILFDDCLAQGKGLVSGARYKGVFIESHGLITVSDSLAAIKELVFNKKLLTMDTVLKALKSNFEGFGKELRLMQNAPKFGNDEPEADNMALEVYNLAFNTTRAQAERIGASFCLATHISVDGFINMGKIVGATPDGRLSGAPFSNSNNPTTGYDRNSVTALLNSMVKYYPNAVAGQVQHLKINRELFSKHRPQLEAMLQTYFDNGGSHLCISVLNKDDLLNAMKEPEKYQNIMVRIGGYSAKFVNLSRELQEDIAARTVY